jgi:hypothetical protein
VYRATLVAAGKTSLSRQSPCSAVRTDVPHPVEDGLKEQVQGAGYGSAPGQQHVPDPIEERDGALDRGGGHGLALSSRELVTQLGHALLELVVARVELGHFERRDRALRCCSVHADARRPRRSPQPMTPLMQSGGSLWHPI